MSIIVYSDYGCGWCAVYDSTLRKIPRQYPGIAKVVYKPYVAGSKTQPMVDVSTAAYCARDEHRLVAFHQAAYNHPRLLVDRDAWRKVARAAGLDDRSQMERCVRGDGYQSRVLKNGAEAESLGFRETPASIIVGRPIVGNVPYGMLNAAVIAAIRRRRSGGRE